MGRGILILMSNVQTNYFHKFSINFKLADHSYTELSGCRVFRVGREGGLLLSFTPAMSSALSYYASKNRASERLENKRNEISRSSAYIIDSSSNNRSSYSSYGGNTASSYGDSRTGRSTYRDRSTDYSARTR